MSSVSRENKLNAAQLRHMSEEQLAEYRDALARTDIYIVLEDVYDTYNVGSFFRLADAIAARQLLLCGETETPPNKRVTKASVGTYKITPWQYIRTAPEAIAQLREEVPDITIVAIEQSEESILYTETDYRQPVAFVLGNEVHGMKKQTLGLCDQAVEIPMHGINVSLNVIVAAGVVMYQTLESH